MSRWIRIIAGCLVAAGFSAAAITLTADGGARTVQLRDDCDPATFNADPPVGPGAPTDICAGDGDTTFAEFIEELKATKVAEKWRYNPTATNDTRLVARNRGGETHTFTPVKEFGGGILPDLNRLSGNPIDPLPECADGAKFGASVVLPGSSTDVITAKAGDHFQCCIHPWMRLMVTR